MENKIFINYFSSTTGLLGFTLLLYPPYPVLLLIHAAWGITSIMTFWGALVKAVRSLGSENEQGKAFGFFEGGSGVTNIIQSAVILGIFAFFAKHMSDKMALSAVITVYSVICLLLGFMIMMLYKDPDQGTAASEHKDGSKSFDWARPLESIKDANNLAGNYSYFYVLCDDH
ncbi:hypothetical protein AABM34_07565 [Lysinibacillus fusiformis]